MTPYAWTLAISSSWLIVPNALNKSIIAAPVYPFSVKQIFYFY